MGGKSTSHSAVLSGSRANKSSGFDLHSWQGLTQVLKQGKESLKDADLYAEFRNLVLEYAQGGGDIELRKQIDTTISSFVDKSVVSNKEVLHTEKKRNLHKQKVQKQHLNENESKNGKKSTEFIVPQNLPATGGCSIGRRRAKPLFKASSQHQVQEQVTKTVSAKSVNKKMKQEIQQPSTSTLTTTSLTPSVKASKISPSIISAQKKSVPISFKSIDEYKARIVEIKRMVHEQIGNPAALVSSHNEFGKKYMMTLLAALKSTGSGSSESPDSAMRRLEDAYKALIEESNVADIKNVPETKSKEIIEPKIESRLEPELPEIIREKKTVPALVTPAISSVPSPVSAKSESVITTQRKENVPIPKSTKIKINAQTKKELKPFDEDESTDAEISRSKLSPANTLAALLSKNEPELIQKFQEKEKTESVEIQETRPMQKLPKKLANTQTKTTNVDIVPVPRNDMTQTKFTKKEIGKNANSGYKPIDAVNLSKIAVRQTELSSPKVSEALHQLLHEWSLFKSSGLLGIGPAGREHPLYQKLSILSMGEVVSGRWEGSDRSVTKTIKEYVDAWRHEQGIAYNIQETFDHYLRRVILRIQQRKIKNE